MVTARTYPLRKTDRELVRLAVPALGAMIAEPVFLLADSAIVGHLGTAQLAGLGVASAVLMNAVLLCTFLAYGTTAAVARLAGSGDMRSALGQGIDGLWLAVTVGVGLAVVGLALSTELVDLFGTSESAAPYAVTYLHISLFGLPSMLLVLAATGVARGLKDTRTPLVITVTASLANVVLNLVLVYPVGLGVAGSALGTVIAQTGGAIWLAAIVVRGARQHQAALRPDRRGILAAASASVPLVVRTVLLRIALIAMTFVATSLGDVALASHQIAWTLWFLLAMTPEAFSIAGQAMVGHALGAGKIEGARLLAHRAVLWGLGTGLVMAAPLILARPLYISLFTNDHAVRDLVWSLAIVVAATQPIGAVVYVLEAVLIAAGDNRFLAVSMFLALVVLLPLAWVVLATGAGVVTLWWTLAAWLFARQVAVYWRYRSGAWLSQPTRPRRSTA